MCFKHIIVTAITLCILGERASGADPIADRAISTLIRAGLLFTEENIFRIKYQEGYNLNFEINEEDAQALLPDNIQAHPVTILAGEGKPRYYISIYVAILDGKISLSRADVFTYGIDQNQQRTLYFLAGIMEVPTAIKNFPLSETIYRKVLEYMAYNSATGKPSYPHFYADRMQVNNQQLDISLDDSWIRGVNCNLIEDNGRFSREFVLANSQIYRNAIDRNVNYFNQGFMDVAVSSWEPSCVQSHQLQKIHPLLASARLHSVQFYGSKRQDIRWYFEM